jgi:hypothetical protein
VKHALQKLARTASGYKRLLAIGVALLTAVSRRLGFDIDPDVILDVVAIVLTAGLGAHVALPSKSKVLPVVPVALVVLLSGCGVLVTEAKANAHLELKVGAPHMVKSFADGELKCHQHGPMELELRGTPGDCILVGADGKYRPCP